ncbi:MAG: Rrf2 family transcriptional regulator [Nitrospirae bacterium]|nr:Rrf2 family transcriptional regulator [Nitrospirota bacterium]MBI3377172.1 Rrf2 family transcriptional regulator [Nitrospirota bacterium]
MYITRETDYGVRCVLYLARKAQDIATVNEIAKAMHIPKSFLAKIVQRLVKAGIVKSGRGIGGGFSLAKKPKNISILDVIKAIQGNSTINICALDKKMCRLSKTCSVHPVWAELRGIIEKRLQKENFAKLI